MAFCPKCNGEMEGTATLCPHCGYDFPSEGQEPTGLAYGRLAQFSLLVGMVLSGIGAVLGIWRCIGALGEERWYEGLVERPMIVLLLVAAGVVFARVADLKK